ncbi:MAG: transcriptional repressor [Treponemataceae bacterium]
MKVIPPAATLLDERGIRPSHQRVRIYEVLAGTKAHPSVDWIYRSLSDELPTLSRTTVYNTLGTLIEAGLAKPVFIEGEEIRYDADMSVHGHFRCRKCGTVYDFKVGESDMEPDLPEGFIAEQVQLNCIGLCPACAGEEIHNQVNR